MKKVFFVALALLAFSSTAKAQDCNSCATETCSRPICDPCAHPFYIAISGGWAHLQDLRDGADVVDMKGGSAINTAIGWYEGDYRIELEYSRFSLNVDGINGAAISTGNAGGEAWFTNAYYDTCLTSKLNAYMGGGLGMARVGTHSLSAAGAGNGVTALSDVVFAYQARVGVSRDLTNRAELFGGYRIIGTANFELDDANLGFAGNTFQDKALVHSLEAGLRFKF